MLTAQGHGSTMLTPAQDQGGGSRQPNPQRDPPGAEAVAATPPMGVKDLIRPSDVRVHTRSQAEAER